MVKKSTFKSLYVYPNSPGNNDTTTSGEEAATKSRSAFFVFRDVSLSAEKWRETDEKKKEEEIE